MVFTNVSGLSWVLVGRTPFGRHPPQFLAEDKKPFPDKYHTIMNVTECVSCVTDTSAIDTYRVLTSISLPNRSP